MSKVKIFTDSTSDLSPELLKQYDIGVVPLTVTFGEEVFKDQIDLTTTEFYQKIEEYGKLPKTAAPSPGDFYQIFEPYINAGQDIIYVGLSSQLSSTYQNAVLASQRFPEGRIVTVDSMNLSTGIGLLVMKAVDYAANGLEIQEIAARLQEKVATVETEFIIDTLEYLHKGGRCSALQNLIGSMLKIRPVVKVVEGRMILSEKLRGKREKALETLLEHTVKNKDKIDLDRIFVTHSLGQEDALVLKGELEKSLPVKEVFITEAGIVISSHCGPNTVGILYLTK